MKLLIFAGSTRAQSFNRRLAKVAAGLARQAGAEVTLLELSSLNIPLYNADLEALGTPARCDPPERNPARSPGLDHLLTRNTTAATPPC